MLVRRATREDDPAILALARQALEAVPHTDLIPLTTQRINALIDACHALEGTVACFVAEADDGQVIGLIAAAERQQQWTGEPYADGLLLWVAPNYRHLVSLHLLHTLEIWAIARGLKLVKMAAPIPSEVGRVFARREYDPVETVYAKRL